MKLNIYIILLLLLSFVVKADQILELIKIPNLTLHKLENKNSLAYLKPEKDFFVGSNFKRGSGCPSPISIDCKTTLFWKSSEGSKSREGNWRYDADSEHLEIRCCFGLLSACLYFNSRVRQ